MQKTIGSGRHRKLYAGILTVGLTLGASAAYAFWTGSGSAGGVASTGSDPLGAVDIQQLVSPRGLTPGGPPQIIRLSVSNKGTAAVNLTKITATVDPAFLAQTDESLLPCTAADFMPGESGAVNVPPQTTVMVDIPFSMKDLATDQENCKNVDVDLVFTPVYPS